MKININKDEALLILGAIREYEKMIRETGKELSKDNSVSDSEKNEISKEINKVEKLISNIRNKIFWS